MFSIVGGGGASGGGRQFIVFYRTNTEALLFVPFMLGSELINLSPPIRRRRSWSRRPFAPALQVDLLLLPDNTPAVVQFQIVIVLLRVQLLSLASGLTLHGMMGFVVNEVSSWVGGRAALQIMICRGVVTVGNIRPEQTDVDAKN